MGKQADQNGSEAAGSGSRLPKSTLFTNPKFVALSQETQSVPMLGSWTMAWSTAFTSVITIVCPALATGRLSTEMVS